MHVVHPFASIFLFVNFVYFLFHHNIYFMLGVLSVRFKILPLLGVAYLICAVSMVRPSALSTLSRDTKLAKFFFIFCPYCDLHPLDLRGWGISFSWVFSSLFGFWGNTWWDWFLHIFNSGLKSLEWSGPSKLLLPCFTIFPHKFGIVW